MNTDQIILIGLFVAPAFVLYMALEVTLGTPDKNRSSTAQLVVRAAIGGTIVLFLWSILPALLTSTFTAPAWLVATLTNNPDGSVAAFLRSVPRWLNFNGLGLENLVERIYSAPTIVQGLVQWHVLAHYLLILSSAYLLGWQMGEQSLSLPLRWARVGPRAVKDFITNRRSATARVARSQSAHQLPLPKRKR